MVLGRRWALGESREDAFGGSRRNDGVAGGHGADGVKEHLGLCVLEQEAARAGGKRVDHVVFVVERGQDDHLRRREPAGDLSGGGDAVEDRHLHVHKYQVDRARLALLEGLGAVGGKPLHRHVRL